MGALPQPQKLKIPIGCLILTAIIVMGCQLFACFAVISGIVNPSPTSTPTLTATIIPSPTATSIPTQTPFPTNTPLPAITPTSTTFISIIQTNAALQSTATLAPSATQPANQNPVCPCAGDTLNCSDFNTHSSAQACFDYCVSQGRGDIHRLDKDGNGSACESLP